MKVITDEEITLNIERAAGIWYSSAFKGIEENEHTFSLRFQKNMRRITRKYEKESHYFTTVGRVAAIIIVSIGVLFAASMSVEAYREKVLNIAKKVFHDSTVFNISSDSDYKEIEEIKISYIPEGFNIEQENKNHSMYIVGYRRKQNERIRISVIQIDNASAFTLQIDTEDAKDEYVSIEGCDAHLYIKGERKIVYWSYDNLVMLVETLLDEEETLKIARSIEIIYK
ncbi:MAG: DUF4367 domain-containing protein [Lachnospiraceae bacterium]|nr:DUF4367 domain-containing protein [Lachnospiraceae bacterium]